MPQLIAISGLMASGKTTLAKNLSRIIGWKVLPEPANAIRFLPDLFQDQKRWAFDAQISFLSDKALQLLKTLDAGYNVVLDRSIYEDIQIFAEYFYKKRSIDERSFETYKNIAEHFLSKVPSPDVLLYSDCDIETIKERLKSRNRDFQNSYPPNHIEELYAQYQTWINHYDLSPAYRIDSAKFDYRKAPIIEEIASELVAFKDAVIQQDMFITVAKDAKANDPILTAVNSARGARNLNFTIRRSAGLHPNVYIAAPFTAVSTGHSKRKSVDDGLFDNSPPHGVIPRSKYRTMLSNLSKRLESIGIKTILPHRDVNDWGKKILRSQEVFEACTDHVRECDMFIGIVGESMGSHYEFGVAIGLNKPCILIRCEEIKNSFISDGVVAKSNVAIFNCKKMNEVQNLLSNNEIRNFISAVLGR